MASYTRLYADEHGDSHFDDIEIDVTLTDYAPRYHSHFLLLRQRGNLVS